MYQRFFIDLTNALARSTLCKLGWHTKPTGVGFDACARDCGHDRHPNAAKPYVVVLKDGSVHHVNAINAYHAGSLVVYGDGPININPDGTPRGEMKVHRSNIQSVTLST
jgi:hypothetical protein